MKAIDWPFWGVLTLLAGTLAGSYFSDRRHPEFLSESLESIPSTIAGWSRGADQTLDARTLSILAPTSYLSTRYGRGEQALDLFIAFYAQQDAGRTMHSPKHCLPGSGWEIWKQDSIWIPVNGQNYRINKYSIQNGFNRKLVYYWYQSRSRIIASEYLGKLMLIRDALIDGRTAAALVRIVVPDDAAYQAEGVKFAAELIPDVHRCFGSGRSRQSAMNHAAFGSE